MSNWSIIENTTEADYAYVSKKGDDLLGDGSKENPYKTIAAGTAHLDALTGKIRRLIIGSGLYINEEMGTRTIDRPIEFIGDGHVVFDGSNLTRITTGIMSDYFYEITFRFYNDNTRFFMNTGSGVSCIVNFKNCFLDNCTNFVRIAGAAGFSTVSGNFYNSIVLNSHIYYISHGSSGLSLYWENSLFVGCTGTAGRTTASYIPPFHYILNNIFIDCVNCNMLWPTTTLKTNNNIIINSLWVRYLTSTTLERDVTTETIVAEEELFIDYIDSDPKFNNEAIGDYTLKPDSPALYGGENGFRIGPFGMGVPFSAQQLFGNRNIANSFGVELLTDVIAQSGADRIGLLESNIIDLGQAYAINTLHIFNVLSYYDDGLPEEIIDYEADDFDAYVDDGSKTYYEGDTCTESATKYRCNNRAGTSGVFDAGNWDEVTNDSPSYFYDVQLQYSLSDPTLSTGLTVSVRTDKDLFAIDGTSKGSADRGFNPETKAIIRMRYFRLRIKMINYSL